MPTPTLAPCAYVLDGYDTDGTVWHRCTTHDDTAPSDAAPCASCPDCPACGRAAGYCAATGAPDGYPCPAVFAAVSDGLHRWLGADDCDACIRCGVAACTDADGARPDALPLLCPGPRVTAPHHFTHAPDGAADCALCACTITRTTDPLTVDWHCPGA